MVPGKTQPGSEKPGIFLPIKMLKLLPQSHDSVFLREQSVSAILGLYKATGSGCTTVVEHMPHDREVMGLNP